MLVALLLYLVGMIMFGVWLAFTLSDGIPNIPAFIEAIREACSMSKLCKLGVIVTFLGWPGCWIAIYVVLHNPSYIQEIKQLLDLCIFDEADNE